MSKSLKSKLIQLPTIPLLDQASSPEEKKAGVDLKLITSEGFLDQSFAVDMTLKQTLGILHAQEKGKTSSFQEIIMVPIRNLHTVTSR